MRYKNIHNHIFNKLIRLIPNIEILQTGTNQISTSKGFMDLYLNILAEEEAGQIKIISLSQYYQLNGDLVPDPDMVIKIHLQHKMAEALTYQDSYGFQEVYPTPTIFYPDLKIKLNSFLNNWLGNCLQQKHGFFNLNKKPILKLKTTGGEIMSK